VSPCGACRQSILEYETLGKQPVKIYLYGDDGIYVVDRVADLLPLHFDSF
jgi:cytidine deaminase